MSDLTDRLRCFNRQTCTEAADRIEALEAELAAMRAGGEPVAEMVPYHTPSGKRVAVISRFQHLPIGTKLYTSPPAVAGELVAPDFYTACAWHDGGGVGGWIALPGYSNETEHGVKHLVLDAARKEGYKGTAAGRLLELGWEIRPVYLTPQPTQAQAVQEWGPVPAKACIKPTYEAADAFWEYWKAKGETHKHGYYESTWGAINKALACGWTQPTQAQAGAVPLTDAQIDQAIAELGLNYLADAHATNRAVLQKLCRHAHGIKGGQHDV